MQIPSMLQQDDFYNYEGAIINADNFNVTTVYSFLNEENSTINANNFNVISGIDFINRKSTINANNFNVTAGYDFYNTHSATIDADTVTIEVTNFADRYCDN